MPVKILPARCRRENPGKAFTHTSRARPSAALCALIVLAGASALASCTKLDALDTVMPYDEGASRIAGGVAYGAHARQKLDVYVPRDGATPAPVVVFLYGGSWDSGRRQDYGFVGHAFASSGFVTVIPDYRRVPAVRYPTFVEDTAAAVRWVRDNIADYGGRAARVAVVGHSAGAYNAVMLGVDPAYTDPESPRYLPVDAVAGLAGPYAFLPLDTAATRKAFKGVDDLEATQPVRLVTEEGPPMFIATGSADTTVEPRNAHALAERARAVGRPVTEHVYKGADHADILLALGRWFRHRAPVLDDLTHFLNRAFTADETVGPANRDGIDGTDAASARSDRTVSGETALDAF